MKLNNLKANLLTALLVSGAVLSTTAVGFAVAQSNTQASPAKKESQQKYAPSPAPVNHSKYLVLMANGVYNPNDTNYTPPDFNYFTQQVMHWNDQQVAQFQDSAVNFFSKTFGINVNDPQYAGRVIMVPFMIDPRWQYRVYTSSGDNVPSKGWVARDGGFQLVVTDPAGIDLGGDFKGWHSPKGTAAVFGKFNVLVSPNVPGEPNEIVIDYQSRQPVVQNSGFPLDRSGKGALVAPFDLYNPTFGHGWGFAHIIDVPQPDGTLQTNNRNIMTFPAGAPYPNTTW